MVGTQVEQKLAGDEWLSLQPLQLGTGQQQAGVDITRRDLSGEAPQDRCSFTAPPQVTQQSGPQQLGPEVVRATPDRHVCHRQRLPMAFLITQPLRQLQRGGDGLLAFGKFLPQGALPC